MRPLTYLSACTGIGGFELAVEIANQLDPSIPFEVQQFIENNSFCQSVLAKQWPEVAIHDDLRTYTAEPGSFDLIIAGLPCPPFSQAGKRKGEADERNLFPEFFRLVRQVQPIGTVIENVPGLLSADAGGAFRRVLWEFARLGFDVEWGVVPCAYLASREGQLYGAGGCHRRERLWIVAYAGCLRDRWKKVEQPVSDGDRDHQASEQEWRGFSPAVVSGGATAARCDQGSGVGRSAQSAFCRGHDGLSHRVDVGAPYLMAPAAVPDWLPYATDSYPLLVNPERSQALQALGNAVVPHSAVPVLLRLKERLAPFIEELEAA